MALAKVIGASPSSQQQTADAATQIGLCRHPGLTAGDGADQASRATWIRSSRSTSGNRRRGKDAQRRRAHGPILDAARGPAEGCGGCAPALVAPAFPCQPEPDLQPVIAGPLQVQQDGGPP
jgi:hypothetical protein